MNASRSTSADSSIADSQQERAGASERRLQGNEAADPGWFREPTRREHWLAAGLFTAFGVFFVVWFAFQIGWWFRWAILSIGLVSLARAARHVFTALRAPR